MTTDDPIEQHVHTVMNVVNGIICQQNDVFATKKIFQCIKYQFIGIKASHIVYHLSITIFVRM